MKHRKIFLLSILAILLFPLFMLVLTMVIGNIFDCRMDEGGTYPCIVAPGIDIGGFLGNALIWFLGAIVATPIALLIIVVWVFTSLVRNRRIIGKKYASLITWLIGDNNHNTRPFE